MINLKKWCWRMKTRRYQKKLDREASFRKFKKACRRAEELAAQTGKQYRVYLFDKYYAWCREDVNRMKNRGVIGLKEETGILSKNVLYDTQGHVNLHPQFSDRIVYNPKSFWNKIFGR